MVNSIKQKLSTLQKQNNCEYVPFIILAGSHNHTYLQIFIGFRFIIIHLGLVKVTKNIIYFVYAINILFLQFSYTSQVSKSTYPVLCFFSTLLY